MLYSRTLLFIHPIHTSLHLPSWLLVLCANLSPVTFHLTWTHALYPSIEILEYRSRIRWTPMDHPPALTSYCWSSCLTARLPPPSLLRRMECSKAHLRETFKISFLNLKNTHLRFKNANSTEAHKLKSRSPSSHTPHGPSQSLEGTSAGVYLPRHPESINKHFYFNTQNPSVLIFCLSLPRTL